MASLASLVVSIGADVSKFDKNIKKAQRQLRKFSRQVDAMAKTTARAAAAILVPVTASIAVWSKFGDSVAKAAKRAGVSTKFLSEIGFAAQLAGSDIAAVEKGMKGLAKTTTFARDGLVTYTRAFNRLGIGIEELEGLNPEELFLKVGDAIGKMADDTTQSAAAQELLGRSGMALIPLFEQGEAAITKQREEAQKLGVSVGDNASLAEEWVDAMTRMKAGLVGIAGAITQAVSGPGGVRSFSDTVVETVATIRQWITDNGALIVSVTKIGLKLAATAIALKAIAIGAAAIAGIIGAWPVAAVVGIGLGIAAAADAMFNLKDGALGIGDELKLLTADFDYELAIWKDGFVVFWASVGLGWDKLWIGVEGGFLIAMNAIWDSIKLLGKSIAQVFENTFNNLMSGFNMLIRVANKLGKDYKEIKLDFGLDFGDPFAGTEDAAAQMMADFAAAEKEVADEAEARARKRRRLRGSPEADGEVADAAAIDEMAKATTALADQMAGGVIVDIAPGELLDTDALIAGLELSIPEAAAAVAEIREPAPLAGAALRGSLAAYQAGLPQANRQEKTAKKTEANTRTSAELQAAANVFLQGISLGMATSVTF